MRTLQERLGIKCPADRLKFMQFPGGKIIYHLIFGIYERYPICCIIQFVWDGEIMKRTVGNYRLSFFGFKGLTPGRNIPKWWNDIEHVPCTRCFRRMEANL